MISRKSWNGFKNLYIRGERWGFRPFFDPTEGFNYENLEKVLDRCGQFLTKICVNGETLKLDSNVVNFVAKSCPNLQYVNIGVVITSCGIKALAESYCNITHLFMQDCTDECDTALSLLFEKNTKLKYLSICGNRKMTGECLLKLNGHQHIESISLTNCKFTSLRYLNVSYLCSYN